jgi:hypothetical protein
MDKGQSDNKQGTAGATQQAENLSPEDIEFKKLSADADAFIKLTRLETFGGEFAFVAQHSRQFKAIIAKYHPADGECYKNADHVESEAIQKSWRMRFWVFALFVIYSSVFALLWTGILSKFVDQFDAYWTPYWVSFGLTVFACFIGWWVRHEKNEKIENHATQFANFILNELTTRHDRTTNAVQLSRTDLMMTPKWPARSAGWIKIALWYARRYEDLGRYVTAVAWRVVSRNRWAMRTALAATFGVVVAVGVVAYLHWSSSADEHLLLLSDSAIYLLTAIFFSCSYGKNDSWSRKFFAGIQHFDIQKRHIHEQIGEVVAADKKYYLSSQRIAGHTPP